MMKILIITTVGFSYGGGISNVIMNYYHSMDKSDMKIDFISSRFVDEELKKELECSGSSVYNLNCRTRNPLEYITKLTKLIKKEKYDIVHAHGNSHTLALEMYAAKKGGAKIRISHSHSSRCNSKFLHEVLKPMFENCYTHAFACGEKAGKWLYNNKPFVIINNGIDIKRYQYNVNTREKYRSLYKLDGKKVVGHIGHFNYQKNHEFLIDIFKELYKLDENYRLMLIGDGELRTNIQEKVDRLGLSDVVIFTGKTLDVPQLMQALDIIVMPSLFEGLPLTLVEAQAACLPCYVSDAVSEEAGITDLVDFISLESTPKEWAYIINKTEALNRKKLMHQKTNEIIKAGYSIVDNAERLKNLYKLYIEQGKN